MMQDFCKCPDEQELINYLLQELSWEDNKRMEEHFYCCPKCTQKAREYQGAIAHLQSMRANPDLGKAYKESYHDIVQFPAAASSMSRGVSEVQSVYGRYSIRLIPFLKRDKSILEVELKDKDIDGVVMIENDDGIIFRARIVNGCAREEVRNPVDLRTMMITIEPGNQK